MLNPYLKKLSANGRSHIHVSGNFREVVGVAYNFCQVLVTLSPEVENCPYLNLIKKSRAIIFLVKFSKLIV